MWDREGQVAGHAEGSAVRSLEARCTVEDVLVLVGGLWCKAGMARWWVVVGGGPGEYRRSREAV